MVAAARSESGRAVLRCLLGCAVQALSAHTPHGDRRAARCAGRWPRSHDGLHILPTVRPAEPTAMPEHAPA